MLETSKSWSSQLVKVEFKSLAVAQNMFEDYKSKGFKNDWFSQRLVDY